MKPDVSSLAPSAAGNGMGALEPVNILIVDDEPRNLVVMESILSDPRYQLIRAHSGEEALLTLVKHEFAVLVLDVLMPGMDGFELAQLVKQRRKTASIPIIFLSATYEDQHVLEGYSSGAVDYLHKPVNPAVLRSKVAVFAELYRQAQALERTNRALTAEVDERRRAEAELSELNKTLDRRVSERTVALQHSEALLREGSRRKDEFLATLAHELRNPLAPVRNALYMLQLKGAQAPEVQRTLALMGRQIQTMTRLIDDLMDVSRITQGRIELQRERVDLREVLEDSLETTRALIDELGHQLDIAWPSAPMAVAGDRTRLDQVFMNLINNAAKYTEAGGKIEITANVTSCGTRVRVCVRDSGIGIAPECLESVFEMFSQVESALCRSRGGLGIGLSLTRQLVQMHGGIISVRSEGLGCGSTFMVELPLAEPVQAH